MVKYINLNDLYDELYININNKINNKLFYYLFDNINLYEGTLIPELNVLLTNEIENV
jgi:hypothetical protein